MQSLGEIAKLYQERANSMKNSSPSLSGPQNEYKVKCKKCSDTGTVNELVWTEALYDNGQPMHNHRGEPIRVQVIKVDPATGRPPLCECHYEHVFEKYNAAAGMKEEERGRTFKTAIIDNENRPHFEIAADFVRNIEQHREAGTWLYIFGDEERAKEYNCSAYGTGKSYLMQCIGNALTHRKIPAIYVPERQLFQDIKNTYDKKNGESEAAVLNRYYNVPILLIDDLFTAQYRDWAEDRLYGILDSRKEGKKITIITSNYAVNRIRERLPINGAKIASRIVGEAQQIEMIGRDRRVQKARSKADKRREWAG